MATKRYRTPRQFSREFVRDIKRLMHNTSDTYLALNLEEAEKELESVAPRDTGTLRRSFRLAIDRKITSNARLAKTGKAAKVGSLDAKFHAVDAGRKRQFYRSGGFSRMGGSPQAPSGMTRPVAARVFSGGRQARLRVRAIRIAESKLR